MEIHPIAALFPLMEGSEFDRLVEDIRTHGLREPIKTWNGMLLDGRNRRRACEAAGVPPQFQELELVDEQAAIGYIISVNIHRRHLNPGQIALVGEALRPQLAAAAQERIKVGSHKGGRATAAIWRGETRGGCTEKSSAPAFGGRVVSQLEKMLNVNHTTLQQAHAVATKAPELASKVRSGEMRLNAAYNQAMGRRREPRQGEIDDARRQAIARDVIDGGKTWDQVRGEYGVSATVIRVAVAQEKGRREPQIDPSTLPMSAQEKLEAAIKQETRRLQAQFEQRVQDEIKARVDEMVLPQYLKEMAEARQVIEARKGAMKRETFRFILSCLHPDQSATKERLSQAFRKFKSLELVLCDEREMPTAPTSPMPRNYEEMMKRRAETMTRRRKSSNGLQQGV